MYKFICANITKSRNFTNSYKKLAQNKKYHLDGSTSKTASHQEYFEEKVEENQEQNEEDIGATEEKARPSTSPAQIERFQLLSNIRNIKSSPISSPSPKIKDYPKFYTGNFLTVEPPTPSISKKYYHVYSITSAPLLSKRFSTSASFRKFGVNEKAKRNYEEAIRELNQIQKSKPTFQWKPDIAKPNKSFYTASDIWAKKDKKKAGKAEIKYPTHTIKHNLTLSQRFRIRQGSAELKVKELQEKFQERKKAQQKVFKNIRLANSITYPAALETRRKGQFNTVLVRSDENKVQKTEKDEDDEPEINIVKTFKTPTVLPQNFLENKKEPQLPHTLKEFDQDFQSLVRCHPTIQNASKEVKMRLKTKYIQLLLKSKRKPLPKKELERTKETEQLGQHELEPTDKNWQDIEKKTRHLAATKEFQDDVLQKEIDQHVNEDTHQITSHPTTLAAKKMLEKEYMVVRYPKRVWVDTSNNYDIHKVCIKDTTTKTGSGYVTRDAKEPKLNYKNLEKEAEQFSKFIHKKSEDAIQGSKKTRASLNTPTGKIEKLKEERIRLMQELELVSKIKSEERAKILENEKKGINKSLKSPDADAEFKIKKQKSEKLTKIMCRHLVEDTACSLDQKRPESIEIDKTTKTSRAKLPRVKSKNLRRIPKDLQSKKMKELNQEAKSIVKELNILAKATENTQEDKIGILDNLPMDEAVPSRHQINKSRSRRQLYKVAQEKNHNRESSEHDFVRINKIVPKRSNEMAQALKQQTEMPEMTSAREKDNNEEVHRADKEVNILNIKRKIDNMGCNLMDSDRTQNLTRATKGYFTKKKTLEHDLEKAPEEIANKAVMAQKTENKLGSNEPEINKDYLDFNNTKPSSTPIAPTLEIDQKTETTNDNKNDIPSPMLEAADEKRVKVDEEIADLNEEAYLDAHKSDKKEIYMISEHKPEDKSSVKEEDYTEKMPSNEEASFVEKERNELKENINLENDLSHNDIIPSQRQKHVKSTSSDGNGNNNYKMFEDQDITEPLPEIYQGKKEEMQNDKFNKKREQEMQANKRNLHHAVQNENKMAYSTEKLDHASQKPKHTNVETQKKHTEYLVELESVEEPNLMDKLNEMAKRKVEIEIKKKTKDEDRKFHEELKKIQNSLPSLKQNTTQPRIDKQVDILNEKVEIGEQSKEIIQHITPEKRTEPSVTSGVPKSLSAKTEPEEMLDSDHASQNPKHTNVETQNKHTEDLEEVESLEEPNLTDKLNETAKRKVEICKKKKIKDEDRKYYEELKEIQNSLPSLKQNTTQPRIDKQLDILNEKVEIGEKSKEIIQHITPEKRTEPSVTLVVPKSLPAKTEPEEMLDPGTKCDELNRTAQSIALKKKKNQIKKEKKIIIKKSPSKNKPSLVLKSSKSLTKFKRGPSDIEKKQLGENEAKTKQDEKNKRDLEEFHQMKNKEWGLVQPKGLKTLNKKKLFSTKDLKENRLEKHETTNKIVGKENISQIKIREKQLGEEKKLKDNQDKKMTEFTFNSRSPKEGNEKESVTSDNDTLISNTAEVRNPKSGYVQKDNVKIFSNDEKNTVDTGYSYLDNSKPTDNLTQVVNTMKGLSLKQSEFEGAFRDKNAVQQFKKQVLSQYFDEKIVPGTQQSIYVPKQRLVVSNIKELGDNRSLFEENKFKRDQEDYDQEDEAVIRTGDEIVIFGNEPNKPTDRFENNLKASQKTYEAIYPNDKNIKLPSKVMLTETENVEDTKIKLPDTESDLKNNVSELEDQVPKIAQKTENTDQNPINSELEDQVVETITKSKDINNAKMISLNKTDFYKPEDTSPGTSTKAEKIEDLDMKFINKAPHSSYPQEQDLNVTEKSEKIKDTEIKLKNKALELKKDFSQPEDQVLGDESKIDDVIEKIRDLEKMLIEQKETKLSETRCGNKARVPPIPKPNPAKDKKDIKKEKPKGSRDMVLPPKIRGSNQTPDKVPKTWSPTGNENSEVTKSPKSPNDLTLDKGKHFSKQFEDDNSLVVPVQKKVFTKDNSPDELEKAIGNFIRQEKLDEKPDEKDVAKNKEYQKVSKESITKIEKNNKEQVAANNLDKKVTVNVFNSYNEITEKYTSQENLGTKEKIYKKEISFPVSKNTSSKGNAAEPLTINAKNSGLEKKGDTPSQVKFYGPNTFKGQRSMTTMKKTIKVLPFNYSSSAEKANEEALKGIQSINKSLREKNTDSQIRMIRSNNILEALPKRSISCPTAETSASCPPASSKSHKIFKNEESKKLVDDISGSRSISCQAMTSKTGKQETKSKFSSWSSQAIPPQRLSCSTVNGRTLPKLVKAKTMKLSTSVVKVVSKQEHKIVVKKISQRPVSCPPSAAAGLSQFIRKEEKSEKLTGHKSDLRAASCPPKSINVGLHVSKQAEQRLVADKADKTNICKNATAPEKENRKHPTTTCCADKNLKQDEPLGTLKILLPKSKDCSKLYSGSVSFVDVKESLKNKKIGYSSETNIGSKKLRFGTKLEPKEVKKSLSIAGISTSPRVYKSEDNFDKFYKNKSKGENYNTKEIPKSIKSKKDDDNKTAIFKIDYDGNVFIIKKADQNFDVDFYEDKTPDVNSTNITKLNKDSIDINREEMEAKIGSKQININDVRAAFGGTSGKEENDKIKSLPKKEKTERKLVAKIEQIIVKPYRNDEDGLKKEEPKKPNFKSATVVIKTKSSKTSVSDIKQNKTSSDVEIKNQQKIIFPKKTMARSKSLDEPQRTTNKEEAPNILHTKTANILQNVSRENLKPSNTDFKNTDSKQKINSFAFTKRNDGLNSQSKDGTETTFTTPVTKELKVEVPKSTHPKFLVSKVPSSKMSKEIRTDKTDKDKSLEKTNKNTSDALDPKKNIHLMTKEKKEKLANDISKSNSFNIKKTPNDNLWVSVDKRNNISLNNKVSDKTTNQQQEAAKNKNLSKGQNHNVLKKEDLDTSGHIKSVEYTKVDNIFYKTDLSANILDNTNKISKSLDKELEMRKNISKAENSLKLDPRLLKDQADLTANKITEADAVSKQTKSTDSKPQTESHSSKTVLNNPNNSTTIKQNEISEDGKILFKKENKIGLKSKCPVEFEKVDNVYYRKSGVNLENPSKIKNITSSNIAEKKKEEIPGAEQKGPANQKLQSQMYTINDLKVNSDNNKKEFKDVKELASNTGNTTKTTSLKNMYTLNVPTIDKLNKTQHNETIKTNLPKTDIINNKTSVAKEISLYAIKPVRTEPKIFLREKSVEKQLVPSKITSKESTKIARDTKESKPNLLNTDIINNKTSVAKEISLYAIKPVRTEPKIFSREKSVEKQLVSSKITTKESTKIARDIKESKPNLLNTDIKNNKTSVAKGISLDTIKPVRTEPKIFSKEKSVEKKLVSSKITSKETTEIARDPKESIPNLPNTNFINNKTSVAKEISLDTIKPVRTEPTIFLNEKRVEKKLVPSKITLKETTEIARDPKESKTSLLNTDVINNKTSVAKEISSYAIKPVRTEQKIFSKEKSVEKNVVSSKITSKETTEIARDPKESKTSLLNTDVINNKTSVAKEISSYAIKPVRTEKKIFSKEKSEEKNVVSSKITSKETTELARDPKGELKQAKSNTLASTKTTVVKELNKAKSKDIIRAKSASEKPTLKVQKAIDEKLNKTKVPTILDKSSYIQRVTRKESNFEKSAKSGIAVNKASDVSNIKSEVIRPKVSELKEINKKKDVTENKSKTLFKDKAQKTNVFGKLHETNNAQKVIENKLKSAHEEKPYMTFVPSNLDKLKPPKIDPITEKTALTKANKETKKEIKPLDPNQKVQKKKSANNDMVTKKMSPKTPVHKEDKPFKSSIQDSIRMFKEKQLEFREKKKILARSKSLNNKENLENDKLLRKGQNKEKNEKHTETPDNKKEQLLSNNEHSSIVSNLKEINETIMKYIASKMVEKIAKPTDNKNDSLCEKNALKEKTKGKEPSSIQNKEDKPKITKNLQENPDSESKNITSHSKEASDNLKTPIRAETVEHNIKNAADKLVKCGIMEEKRVQSRTIVDEQVEKKLDTEDLTKEDTNSCPKMSGKNEPGLKLSEQKIKHESYFAKLEKAKQEKRRKEIQEKMKLRKMEERVDRNREKSKKEQKINEMNTAAQHIYKLNERKEWEEMIKGNRRQKMYEKDAIVSKPSVGSAPWGSKIKPENLKTQDDKKNMHNATNVTTISSTDKLLSKTDYLNLKKQLESLKNKNSDKTLEQQEVLNNKNQIEKNLKQKDYKESKSEVSLFTAKKTDLSTDVINYKISTMAKLLVQNSKDNILNSNVEESKPVSINKTKGERKANSLKEKAENTEIKKIVFVKGNTENFNLVNRENPIPVKKEQIKITEEQNKIAKDSTNNGVVNKNQDIPPVKPINFLNDSIKTAQDSLKTTAQKGMENSIQKEKEAKSTHQIPQVQVDQIELRKEHITLPQNTIKQSKSKILEGGVTEQKKADGETLAIKKSNLKDGKDKLKFSPVKILNSSLEYKPVKIEKEVMKTKERTVDFTQSVSDQDVFSISKKPLDLFIKCVKTENINLEKDWISENNLVKAIKTDTELGNSKKDVMQLEETKKHLNAAVKPVQGGLNINDNRCGIYFKCPKLQDFLGYEDNPSDNSKKPNENFKSKDEEKGNTDLIKGPFIFKPKIHQKESKKNQTSAKLSKSKKKIDPTYKINKPSCKKHLLPMRNPKEVLKEQVPDYQSTLHKPVGNKIKKIPKEISELAGKGNKKVWQPFAEDAKKSDPLSKYRHLKITYITIKRPKSKEENFLPAVVKNGEKKEMSEEEKNAIINFRFELLRRLSEDFNQTENHSSLSKPPKVSSFDKVPHSFNKPPVDFSKSPSETDKPVAKIIENVKNSVEENPDSKNMRSARVLLNLANKASFKNAKDTLEESGEAKRGDVQNKKGKGKYGKRSDDGDDKNGIGGSRKYSTDADKYVGSNQKDKKEKEDLELPKPDPYQQILDSKKTNKEITDCPETQSIESKSSAGTEGTESSGSETSQQSQCEEEGFDIAQAVPHAFECASPRLEEDRQKDLYYRYHQLTFYDLYEYLNQKRTFAVDKAEAEKKEDTKQLDMNATKQEETKNKEDCKK